MYWIKEGRSAKIGPNLFQIEDADIHNKRKRKAIFFPGIIDDQYIFGAPNWPHKGEIYTEAKARCSRWPLLLIWKCQIQYIKQWLYPLLEDNTTEPLRFSSKLFLPLEQRIALGWNTQSWIWKCMWNWKFSRVLPPGNMVVDDIESLEGISEEMQKQLIAIHSENDHIIAAPNLAESQSYIFGVTIRKISSLKSVQLKHVMSLEPGSGLWREIWNPITYLQTSVTAIEIELLNNTISLEENTSPPKNASIIMWFSRRGLCGKRQFDQNGILQ